MTRIRGKLAAAFILLLPAAAQAELYKDLARGLALFDFQFSGERNVLGDGLTVNASAFYNNRRFDFGVADLTLTGVLGASAGYTKRGIPALNFGLTSGGTPLTYNFNINNGIQDLNATGSSLIDIDTHINALGFYDQSFQISNRGTFHAAGFGLVDSGTIDYDIGPINIHGNIFADGLAALTEPFFAANDLENPFAKFSARAAKAAELEKSAEALRSRIQAGEVLNDDEIAKLVNDTIMAAMLGGEPERLDQLFIPFDILQLQQDSPGLQAAFFQEVPEPASALLLGLGLMLPLARRRAH